MHAQGITCVSKNRVSRSNAKFSCGFSALLADDTCASYLSNEVFAGWLLALGLEMVDSQCHVPRNKSRGRGGNGSATHHSMVKNMHSKGDSSHEWYCNDT